MAYKRKTWADKMKPNMGAHVEKTVKKFADVPEGVKMLIVTPDIVDEYVRHIPKGTHTSLQQMRKDLAADHNADYSCPVTSGICLRIVAENAYEEYIGGKPVSKIAPFWRMVDSKVPLSKKLSFGMDFVTERRSKEGLDT
jgi:hypothetical protein